MAIVGIDLGTTNSLISVFKNGNVEQIPNNFGELLTPSVVSFEKDGKIHVGKIAKERVITHPECTVASFKSFMGTDKKYNIYGKKYSPEELSALVIKQLINDAEKYLGERVEEAIISVPAYFNNKQRNATKNAGMLAGVKVERIINEPSAAASYYYVSSGKKQTFLVFDFGGGTLDISIVDAFENIIEVVAIVGNNHLGGNDFDLLIAKDICKQNYIEWEKLDSKSKEKILKIAESCKFILNTEKEAIVRTTIGEKEIEGKMSRKHLVEISSEIFGEIKNLLEKIIRDSGILPEEIDNILLVGGSSNMKIVQDYISFITHKNLLYNFKPDMLVGLGAGMVAGIKERKEELKDIVMTDVCPFSLGVGTYNRANKDAQLFSAIIQRNTTLPVSRVGRYVTVSNNQQEIQFDIYQGDNYYCSDNLNIGTFTVKVPPAPAGEEGVDVRFTYNINGILEVDATVTSTGEKTRLYIQNDDTNFSEEEMKQMMEQLSDLKKDYREQEENIYVLELGKKLYEENLGEIREYIGHIISFFDSTLATQDDFKIRKAREKCKKAFEKIESDKYGDNYFENFMQEIDNIDEEDDENGEDDLGDFTSRYTDE